MAQGFYELLGVDRGASLDDVRVAYQRQLAALVRRLRAAHKIAADVSVLDAQERELKEAMEVLTDPVRRRRYDAFLRAVDGGLPEDAEGLWEAARPGLIDPAAAAALEVVRALTDLPLGDGLPMAEGLLAVTPEPAPAPAPTPPPRPVLVAPPPVVAFAPQVLIDDDELDPEPELDDETWELFDRDRASADRPVLARPAAVAHVSHTPARSPPPPPKDPISALEDRFGLDGRYLRGVRELRGLSIEELARTTRISQRYLEAIEENGYDRLPAGTFVRGYVKSMARLLELDEASVTEGYMALFTHHRG